MDAILCPRFHLILQVAEKRETLWLHARLCRPWREQVVQVLMYG